jgi:ABC-type polysaccharide/polyol phosphate export permease
MDLLPEWLQTVATYNPVSYICDLLRFAALGEVHTEVLLKACAGIVVVGAITQALVWRAERKLVLS